MQTFLHCKKCKMVKPSDDFYSYQPGECKACICARVRANRAENIDHYRKFDQARSMRPDRVAARAAYANTEAGRAAHLRARKAYAERLPERRAAHIRLGNAVRDGRVIPWPVCALPECDAKPEAHHPDYGQPLQVVWLCPAHHKQAHALATRT